MLTNIFQNFKVHFPSGSLIPRTCHSPEPPVDLEGGPYPVWLKISTFGPVRTEYLQQGRSCIMRLNLSNCKLKVEITICFRILSSKLSPQNYNFTRFCVSVTWSLTLREDIDWLSSRTGCWGEYLNLRGRKWQQTGENQIMRSFIICIFHQILLRWSN